MRTLPEVGSFQYANITTKMIFMKKRYIVSCSFAFLCIASAFCKPQPKWNAPLKQAPKLSSGSLPNGMRYLIYPTHTQPGKVSIRLLVNAGAAMETDKEDGIAHFIEHMAFNGTDHFKPGTLIHWFNDNGMGFGNDTNAFTSYLHTCFQIDLPKNDTPSIEKGFLVSRDQGFGCLFLPEEIDRERGVILSEMRTRDSAAYRSMKAFLEWVGHGTYLANRFVIGREETIKNFISDDFFGFYKKWYTPDNMTVIVTGDCNSKKMLSQLKKAFQDKRVGRPQDAKTPQLQVSAPKEDPEVLVYNNKDLAGTRVVLHVQKNIMPRPATLQTFKEDAAWVLINIIIDQRLEDLKNKTCLTECNFERQVEFETLETGMVSFVGEAKDIESMIRELEKFNRSIRTFGFSQQELNSAKKIYEGKLKLSDDAERNATPRELAEGIVMALIEKNVVTSARQDLENFEKIQSFITPEYCEGLWRSLFGEGAFLFVSTPDATVTAENVKKFYLESQKVVLEIPQNFQNLTFQSPFKTLKPSQVCDRHFFEKIGIETLRLDNNVRINLKKTDFEKNRIWIHVNLGNGLLDFINTPYPGLNLLLGSSFVAGGLQQMDHSALKRVFDGKCVSLDFDVEDDNYAFKCVTNQECLLEQLQLVCAYLLEPGYREEGVLNFRKMIPVWYSYFEHNCEGVFKSDVVKFLANNDIRYGYPSQEEVLKRNFDEAKKVLEPVFAKAYMEVTVIGDFDTAQVMKYLQDTFGQLNKREATKAIPESLRMLLFPEMQTKIFPCQSELDKAIVYIVWPTESVWNIQHRRILAVAKAILSDRLLQAIRQTQGDTYSPRVQSIQSELFKNRGHMGALLMIAPEKLDTISDQIMQIAEDMALKGITQAELDRAVKPIVSSLEQSRRNNKFWMDWIRNFQQYPEKQMWDLENETPYLNLTVEDVNVVAKKYFQRKSAICVQIKPEKLENNAEENKVE